MRASFVTVHGFAQPNGAASPSVGGSSEGIAVQGVPQGNPPPGPAGGFMGGGYTSILMMLAMFAAFYFLLIRPQQKKAKEHQRMLDGIAKGDEVVTGGGLIGKVTGTNDNLLTLEISEKVRVRVVKAQVVDKYKN